MQHRGGAVTVRLLVVLAASMVAVWILAGGELTVHHSMSGAGVALAAAAVTPALLTADRHDASPSLKSLAAQAGRSASRSGATSPSRMAQPLGRRPFQQGTGQRPASQTIGRREPVRAPGVVPSTLPGPLLSFDGAKAADNVAGGRNGCGTRALVAPSDSEGDVGPDHYVEWVNCLIQVFDKRGNTLLGPMDGNALFAGFGGACELQNKGDPIVLYDRQADRWLLSQFATPAGGPSHQCLAISQTPNPTGSYSRYDFAWPRNKLNDYVKLGVWPDGWYATANQFDQTLTAYLGVGVVAFNRAAMLDGGPGTALYVDMADFAPSSFGLLPSHLNGPTLPPPGSPNYLVEVEGPPFDPVFPSDRLQVWQFHADFDAPANASFTGPIVLAVEPFDPLLCSPNPFEQICIPQPGTATLLDALPDRLMYRNNYRRFADHEALVVNQTIDGTGDDISGIRWYELRIANRVPSLYQQGTFAPDEVYRWMGSANFDAAGNIAIGYSASNESVFPSIRYAARTPTDPLGTLGLGEGTLLAGTGSQTAPDRWGDYSTLSVDPSDDCTFWYVNQYYAVTSQFNWRTRIATFRLPGCVASTPPARPGSPPPAASDDGHVHNDGADDSDRRVRPRTEQQRQMRQRTDASGPDDTHIAGNVLVTHLDESPPWIVVANRDGDVRVILYEEAAHLTIRVGQYFSGTGEKQHEGLFWADGGTVE
jgi:hypothetical protein